MWIMFTEKCLHHMTSFFWCALYQRFHCIPFLHQLIPIQRAMLGEEGEGSCLGELMELPIGRSTEELTEEMLLKKTEKNRKRRIAAQKRKEKRKVCCFP